MEARKTLDPERLLLLSAGAEGVLGVAEVPRGADAEDVGDRAIGVVEETLIPTAESRPVHSHRHRMHMLVVDVVLVPRRLDPDLPPQGLRLPSGILLRGPGRLPATNPISSSHQRFAPFLKHSTATPRRPHDTMMRSR